MTFLKRLAAALPGRWQSELKRRRFARQIRNGTFATDEPVPETFAILAANSHEFEHDEVALVKIDAEGHEASVLEGMQGFLERAKPVLIVETESEGVIAQLTAKGYDADRLDGSPNVLFTPNGPAQRTESLLL